MKSGMWSLDLDFVILLCELKGKKIVLFRGGQISSPGSQDKQCMCGFFMVVAIVQVVFNNHFILCISVMLSLTVQRSTLFLLL